MLLFLNFLDVVEPDLRNLVGLLSVRVIVKSGANCNQFLLRNLSIQNCIDQLLLVCHERQSTKVLNVLNGVSVGEVNQFLSFNKCRNLLSLLIRSDDRGAFAKAGVPLQLVKRATVFVIADKFLALSHLFESIEIVARGEQSDKVVDQKCLLGLLRVGQVPDFIDQGRPHSVKS